MSDSIKHECGICHVRLLKPLSYYQEKYGTPLYGLLKTQELMLKMQNRGQDGAGVATIKLDLPPGHRYISRLRSKEQQPVNDLFEGIRQRIEPMMEQMTDLDQMKKDIPFLGEVYLGHVRYGTFGKNSIESVHPFIRQNNWMTRNLIMAGNFNMTNVKNLFDDLIDLGQHPKEMADTVTVMENIGHFLDDEVMNLYYELKDKGYDKKSSSKEIAKRLDVGKILQRASRKWDGGYVMGGLLGHGDSFVFRDPRGIRPAYFHCDDEVVVVASERAPIQSCFGVPFDQVKELRRGHAMIIKSSGEYSVDQIKEPQERRACSFERIYFSRSNDAEIYNERKALGENLAKTVLKEVDYDLERSVFSFIPNTSETAFYGMMQGINLESEKLKINAIRKNPSMSEKELQDLMHCRPRVEKVILKDAKVRTFISQDSGRNSLVSSAYDITYGVIQEGDNVVLLDDSIVRGTTLERSVLRIVDQLKPKKIVIVSSAPQIRYPDCYGIDMARLGDFIAFRATVELLKDRGNKALLEKVYTECKAQAHKDDSEIENYVKQIYDEFTDDEISDKIAEMISHDIDAEVKVIFQPLDLMHQAIPENNGDWYFSGDFPTPGGMRVLNQAFVNYMERVTERAY